MGYGKWKNYRTVRLNPEINDSIMNYCGHIMYGVIPSKRKKGYGSIIYHLLVQKMNELGYKEIIVTCSEDIIASSKVIEKNSGVLIDILDPDIISTCKKTKRYKIDVKESLSEY